MLNTKEKAIFEEIEKEKKELFKDILELSIFPKDIIKQLNESEKIINEVTNKLISDDLIDFDFVNKSINRLIQKKLYFNKLNLNNNFLKHKIKIITTQTRLNMMTNNFQKTEEAKVDKDELEIKLDSINSIYNLILDIVGRIKNTKDVIDTTLISLQGQLKNTSFEYLNSSKIN